MMFVKERECLFVAQKHTSYFYVAFIQLDLEWIYKTEYYFKSDCTIFFILYSYIFVRQSREALFQVNTVTSLRSPKLNVVQ